MNAPRVTFEAFVAQAMRSPDPIGVLNARRGDPALDGSERAQLAAIDDDGFRISALLVAKLRFERLLQGSPQAERGFELDAEAFAAVFREYHAQIPMRSPMPWDEARSFEQWVEREAR
jgi:hypothetical protein